MKRIRTIMGVALAATVLAATLATAEETVVPPCLGGQRGAGRMMTPEQRAEHQKAMQEYVAGLRAKKANGTLTKEEQIWQQQLEQRGGMCINGVPRGPRGGFGAPGQGQRGQGNGFGRGGMRHGWCGGAGAGTNCPFASVSAGK